MSSNILTVPGTIKAQTGNNNLGIDVSNNLDISYTTLGPVSTTGTVQRLAVDNWTGVTGFEALRPTWASTAVDPNDPTNIGAFIVGSVQTNQISYSFNGTSFTTVSRNTSGVGVDFMYDIAWSPELKIAVGVGPNTSGSIDIVFTSNGSDITRTWITRDLPTSSQPFGVTWSSELGIFVVVGVGDIIYTSSDSINWFSHETPITLGFNTVIWAPELSLFVATSNTNTFLTSLDGENWVSDTFPVPISNTLNSIITWGPEAINPFTGEKEGMFMITSYSANYIAYIDKTFTNAATVIFSKGPNSTQGIWVSELNCFAFRSRSDFIMVPGNSLDNTSNWYRETNGITSKSYTGLTYSPKFSKFLLTNGTDFVGGATEFFYLSVPDYSTINKNTVIGTRGAGGPDGNTVEIQGNTLKIGEGSNSVSVGKYGRTVTVGSSQSTETRITGNVRTGAEYLVDVREASGVYNSTWKSGTFSSTTLNNSLGVDWSPKLGIFLSVGDSRAEISKDGINWDAFTITAFARNVVWSSELEIFVITRATNAFVTTYDGNTFTNYAIPISADFCAVTWSPELGIFSAVSRSVPSLCMVSSNGENWRTFTGPSGNYCAMEWSPELGIFVTTGQAADIAYSYNGVNWTTVSSFTGVPTSLTWSSELGIFIIPITNAVVISLDGINWNEYSVPTGIWKSIGWSPQLGLFVVTQDLPNVNNRIIYSNDGYNWKTQTIPFGLNYRHVTWAAELGIFCITEEGSGAGKITLVNVPDYSYQEDTGKFPTKTITLGTRGVNDNKVSIEGQDIEVGKASNTISIGQYASNITIGSPSSIINFGGLAITGFAFLGELSAGPIPSLLSFNWDNARKLNVFQTNNINVTLDPINNEYFVLENGIYFINASVPTFGSTNFGTRLEDITTNTVLLSGTTGFSDTTDYGQATSNIKGVISINNGGSPLTEQQLQIQNRVNSTAADGFGKSVSIPGVSEAYFTRVLIYKIGSLPKTIRKPSLPIYLWLYTDVDTGDNYLNIAEMEIYLSGSITNLALGKDAFASSIWGSWGPSLLVDGVPDNFAHTLENTPRWFRVNLGVQDPNLAYNVNIINRAAEQDRADGVNIYITNSDSIVFDSTTILWEDTLVGLQNEYRFDNITLD